MKLPRTSSRTAPKIWLEQAPESALSGLRNRLGATSRGFESHPRRYENALHLIHFEPSSERRSPCKIALSKCLEILCSPYAEVVQLSLQRPRTRHSRSLIRHDLHDNQMGRHRANGPPPAQEAELPLRRYSARHRTARRAPSSGSTRACAMQVSYLFDHVWNGSMSITSLRSRYGRSLVGGIPSERPARRSKGTLSHSTRAQRRSRERPVRPRPSRALDYGWVAERLHQTSAVPRAISAVPKMSSRWIPCPRGRFATTTSHCC